MMRKFSLLFLLVVVIVSLSLGQSMKYGYDGPFPDTSKVKLPVTVVNGGLGVDPEGKVWIQAYTNVVPRDTILTAEGTYVDARPVYVFKADGTPASFSPIRILSAGGNTDTLRSRLGYGGSINPKTGNFVGAWGSWSVKPGALFWEINYKTGAGVTRILNPPGLTTNSPASVGVNSDGEYFLSGVLGGIAGQILNPDGSAGTQYATGVASIGRAMAVSLNGNDIYCPRFTAAPPMTYVYHSDNGSLGPYTLKDSILVGASVESIAIHPKTGYVWMSADRRSATPTNGSWNANTFYAWDPVTKAVVDSFQVTAWDQSATGPLPRGIAFSPTGDTVYVAHFDVATLPAVVRFVKNKAVSVERNDSGIPTGYELSQNYPNPFNPSTQIRFSIAKTGMTTLKVYDVMGREVSTLVNESLNPGTYNVQFDASNLSSGTYLYVMTSGSTRLTNKMVLVK
jgi:hypothetical protein